MAIFRASRKRAGRRVSSKISTTLYHDRSESFLTTADRTGWRDLSYERCSDGISKAEQENCGGSRSDVIILSDSEDISKRMRI